MIFPKILTKDEWSQLNSAEKKIKLEEVLLYLYNIENGNHPLYKTEQQGKISYEKTLLTKFIHLIIDCEKQEEL